MTHQNRLSPHTIPSSDIFVATAMVNTKILEEDTTLIFYFLVWSSQARSDAQLLPPNGLFIYIFSLVQLSILISAIFVILILPSIIIFDHDSLPYLFTLSTRILLIALIKYIRPIEKKKIFRATWSQATEHNIFSNGSWVHDHSVIEKNIIKDPPPPYFKHNFNFKPHQ